MSAFGIIPCSQWGAKPPRHAIGPSLVKVDGSLVHHTAGHHPNLDAHSGESLAEAKAYARIIQQSHFGRGFADTGQNFTITRNGYIFEGRHRSLELLQHGAMPQSAHCPGQNGSSRPGHAKIGVEWEHLGHEPATPIQYDAAVWLYALICTSCKLKPETIFGHRDFFATDCPDVLYRRIPQLRKDVAAALKPKAHYYQLTTHDEHGMTTVTTQTRRTFTIAPNVLAAEIQRNEQR